MKYWERPGATLSLSSSLLLLFALVLVPPPTVHAVHDLPTVLLIGVPKWPLPSGRTIKFLTNPWNVQPQVVFAPTDNGVNAVIRQWRPDCIVSFAKPPSSSRVKVPFPELNRLPWNQRRTWLHFSVDPGTLDDETKFPESWWTQLSANVEEAMFQSWLVGRNGVRADKDLHEHPLVSLFTPTYHGGAKLWRVFWSLRNQTYDNWEWVVIIDDPADAKSVRELRAMGQLDGRLHFWLPDSASGIIGFRKRQAAMLSSGDILIEMDHDDSLLPHALAGVVESFAMHPDVGFVYSDFSEPVWGTNHTKFGNYGKDFPLHFVASEQGQDFLATKTRPLNERNLYHLAALPNHLRAWNATVYRALNGHRSLIVGDDYELLMRTFLVTRSMYYDRLSYLQYRNMPAKNEPKPKVGAASDASGNLPWDNFTFRRNRLIQWIVAGVYQRYWGRLHDRAAELGPGDLHFTYGWRDDPNNVTVVLPVVDAGEELGPAIWSVRHQSFEKWTLLVVTGNVPCSALQVGPGLTWHPVTLERVVLGKLKRVPSAFEFRAVEDSRIRCLRMPAKYAGDRWALRDRGAQLATSFWVAHLTGAGVWHWDLLRDAIAAVRPGGTLNPAQFLVGYSLTRICDQPSSVDHIIVARSLHWSSAWRQACQTDRIADLLHDPVIGARIAWATECHIQYKKHLLVPASVSDVSVSDEDLQKDASDVGANKGDGLPAKDREAVAAGDDERVLDVTDSPTARPVTVVVVVPAPGPKVLPSPGRIAELPPVERFSNNPVRGDHAGENQEEEEEEDEDEEYEEESDAYGRKRRSRSILMEMSSFSIWAWFSEGRTADRVLTVAWSIFNGLWTLLLCWQTRRCCTGAGSIGDLQKARPDKEV